MTTALIGNFDLASAALWLFWIFFALLIFISNAKICAKDIQWKMTMGRAANQGPFPLPDPKTFAASWSR